MEIVTSQSSKESLGTSYQTLVLEAYGSIGEPDSMYGAGAGRLADIDSRVRTYMHEQAWDKALGKETVVVLNQLICVHYNVVFCEHFFKNVFRSLSKCSGRPNSVS